jgi:molecular chaperone GrpE
MTEEVISETPVPPTAEISAATVEPAPNLEQAVEDTPPAILTSQDPLEQMMKKMDAMLLEMKELGHGFEVKLKYDASKDKIIDNMHRELQDYREDLYARLLRPVVMDLISMHDDLGRILAAAPLSEGASDGEKNMRRNLESFLDSIEILLEKLEVQAFTVEGDGYVFGRQKVLRTILTTDPALDRKVAAHLRKGFESGGKVIRPEVIATFKYAPATTE